MTATWNALYPLANTEQKVYMVCVRKVSPEAGPDTPLFHRMYTRMLHSDPVHVDQALSPLGDWLRYNASTWFVRTHVDADHVGSVVRGALAPSDSVLVIRADPRDFGGWAPPDVWEWLQSKRSPNYLADYAGGGGE